MPFHAMLTKLDPDDPDIYDGAPIGIQIVARKYEEEKVWAVGRIVDAILRTAGIDVNTGSNTTGQCAGGWGSKL